jgi:hypothetical protein
LNENQCLLPERPEATQYHPEQPVRRSKPRLRMPPPQYGELLPKRKVFQEELTARTKDVHSQSMQKPQQTQHDSDSIREFNPPRRRLFTCLI